MPFKRDNKVSKFLYSPAKSSNRCVKGTNKLLLSQTKGATLRQYQDTRGASSPETLVTDATRDSTFP